MSKSVAAEQTARELIAWWRDYRQLVSVPEWYDPLVEKITDALLTRERDARRLEREACARIADATKGGSGCGEYDSCPLDIAEAIRARTPAPTKE